MIASVLVVDDDRDTRAVLVEVLRHEGFAVREAANGLEALEQIAEREPDFILLDLIMPVVTGWEVMRMLRAAGRSIPLAVLSGIPAAGCTTCLPKPVSLDRLLQLVETIRAGAAFRMTHAQ